MVDPEDFKLFKSSMVDSIQLECGRVDRLEIDIKHCREKQNKKYDLSIKQMQFQIETSCKKLIKLESAEKIEAIVVEVDAKFEKLESQIKRLTTICDNVQQEPPEKKEDEFASKLDNLSKQIFVEMKNLRSELSQIAQPICPSSLSNIERKTKPQSQSYEK